MNLYILELYICKSEKSKCKKETYTAFPHFWSVDWGSYNDDTVEKHKSISKIHI